MKPGYKQTDVGVIPEEWEVKPFCEIGKLTKGKGLLKEDIKRSGSIPAIPYTALYTDFSEVLDYSLIKWFIDDETQSVIVREPCLLFASSSNMEANTGKASALVGTTLVAIGREVIVFKTSSDCKFISYLLSTPLYRRKTLTLARGTTIKHVYPATFQTYQVALPPLPEQRAIATALSDVDGLLGGLDRLIAKKRDLKQAAMQQLLTGQTRLPGFHSEWDVKTLHDVCQKIQDGTHFSPKLGGNDYLYVTSKNIRFGKLDMSTAERISGAEHSKIFARCDVKKGDLLLTKDGANTGNAALNPMGEPFSLLSSVAMLRFDSRLHASGYFMYQILSTYGQMQIKEAMSGNAITRLTLKKIRALRFSVAPLPEQIAIAEVLTDMDAELAVVEQRREKTRALKQAMMQELLTGRTRLV